MQIDTLKDMVILDAVWLAHIMTGLVSFKNSWKNGVIDHEMLKSHVWKNEGVPVPKLLALLERFDIISPMTGTFIENWKILGEKMAGKNLTFSCRFE